MRIEIVPSLSLHVPQLAKTLREKDRIEAEGLGLNPRKAVFKTYKGACYRRTCLIDDEVAAMWGLHGELLGNTGRPYLMTGTVCERVSPLTFARIYKQEVHVMKEFFPELVNIVDASYYEAIRILKLSGFTVSKPFCYGPEGRLFCRFSL